MHCKGIGTVVHEDKLIQTLFFDPIVSPCVASSSGKKPTDDAECHQPTEALALQVVESDHESHIRPWWDYMNDPDHPSRRKPRPRSADEMSCGPLGGLMGLDWYWIGCPSPYSKRPKTPAFYH